MKPYKSSSPEDTIFRIKSILHDLGLTVKETHIDNGTFYSCRLKIANGPLIKLEMGQNGKGLSFTYSLASGYGELAERLQNRIMISNGAFGHRDFVDKLDKESEYYKLLKERNLILDFKYDPQEEKWPRERVERECMEQIRLLSYLETSKPLDYLYKDEEYIMVPFYDVYSNVEKFLPVDMLFDLVGSNGMYAGNTPKEAILQGLCEIFERHVKREIFHKNLTPPTIPIEEFAGTNVYQIIEDIREKHNYEIIIKDCSLGVGLPVFGIMILDRENQTYNFKLGSDFVPAVAIERCLTEIHQNSINYHSVSMETLETDARYPDHDDHRQRYINLKRSVVDGSGKWPMSIFFEEPSYEFQGFDQRLGMSDDEDLSYCLELIKSLGYKMFIRDVSILGFPAYFIVIPGMSQVFFEEKHYVDYKQYKNNYMGLVRRLGNISDDHLKFLQESLIDNYTTLKESSFTKTISSLFLYNTSSDILKLNLELLIFMVSFCCGDYKNAEKYLSVYLTNKNKGIYKYFYAIRDYINYIFIRKIPVEQSLSVLSAFYGSLVYELHNDLSDKNHFLRNHDFPSCFECEKCDVKDTCCFLDALEIEKKLNDKALKAQIKQTNLYPIFNG